MLAYMYVSSIINEINSCVAFIIYEVRIYATFSRILKMQKQFFSPAFSGLATHEPNFTIIREEFVPNKPRPCNLCGQVGQYYAEHWKQGQL